MNDQRRKAIQKIIYDLNKASGLLADLKNLAEELKTDLEDVRDEEQEYYDNMPDSLQNSDRGYNAEAAVSALDNAMNELDSIIDLSDCFADAASQADEATS